MNDAASQSQETSLFVVPRPGWARAVADFDKRAFGPDAWPYEQWVYELSRGPSIYRAIVEDNGLSAVPRILAVGGVSLGPEAEILTVAVDETRRGEGLGGKLVDELVNIASLSGAQQVFLEVRSRGEVARRLYAARGFRDVGLRKGYYSDDDAVIMRLDLV